MQNKTQSLLTISNRIIKDTKKEQTLKINGCVRKELVRIILAITGWQSLEPFVEIALDDVLLGKPVDLRDFMTKINAWKLSNLSNGGE